jgi:hypothetical protein
MASAAAELLRQLASPATKMGKTSSGDQLMAIHVSCPQCQKDIEVPDDLAGKRIRCKACSATMAVPMTAEVVDDEPSPPAADDDAPLEAEIVQPGPERPRGRRKKRSALKVVLILGLVGGLLACLAGAGGTAVWYFALRDTGLAGDMKYLPDNFSRLHVVHYDVVKSAPAFAKAQNCPGGKNRFAFMKPPDGKTPDVVDAIVGGNPSETVTVLRLRNPVTIQDLVGADAKLAEATIEGKKVYQTDQTSYLIEGKRVVFAYTPTMQRVLKRGGKPRLTDAMQEAMKVVDFSRPETQAHDLGAELAPVREFMTVIGQELPLAYVQDFDYQLPMNSTTRFVCKDEKAAEAFVNTINGPGRRTKMQMVEVRRKGALITVEGKADDPCDALGPQLPTNPFGDRNPFGQP